MSTRKLDPAWMEAMGFIWQPEMDWWHNATYNLQLLDGTSPVRVVQLFESRVRERVREGVRERVIREQQTVLRQALLPALGLEEHAEHDEHGHETRRYLRVK